MHVNNNPDGHLLVSGLFENCRCQYSPFMSSYTHNHIIIHLAHLIFFQVIALY